MPTPARNSGAIIDETNDAAVGTIPCYSGNSMRCLTHLFPLFACENDLCDENLTLIAEDPSSKR